MRTEDVLLLARGHGGVGCWTLNRNFVRVFGTDAAFILSDLIRAFLYGDKIHTNIEEWFLWNPNNVMNICGWPKRRFNKAMDILMDLEAIAVEKFDDEVRFSLNFENLYKIGGAFEVKGVTNAK